MVYNFEIDTLGWFACLITDKDGKIIRVSHASDYGDKFQELINNVLTIYDHFNDQDILAYPFTVETNWCDDSMIYIWRFDLLNIEGSIYFEMNQAPLNKSSDKTLLMKAEIDIYTVMSDFYLSLDKLFKEFGFVGYKKNWEVGNFPTGDYLKLKALILEEQISATTTITSTEWKGKIDLVEEWNLLIK